MRYSKLFAAEIYEGSTSILLGGLYLIWCDANINSDSVETLVLLLVYVYFIRVYLFEYCHSIQGIEDSRGALEKIKVREGKVARNFKKNSNKNFNFFSKIQNLPT